MINQIIISNFQSHKKTTLDFGPGVNVIIGRSDSGKSAIIRALTWVISNRPTGDSFRSVWGGETSVRVGLDNELAVVRVKSDKDNTYQLKKGDELLSFKAMGTEVPEEVQQALDFSEFNIQYQMDAPFMLSKSSGEVARMLNNVAHIDDIDSTLSNIEARKRRAKSDISNKEEQLVEANEGLQEFDNLDDIEKKMKTLWDMGSDLTTLVTQHDAIADLVTSITDARKKMATIPDTEHASTLLTQLSQVSKDITATEQKRAAIAGLVTRIEYVNTHIAECSQLLEYELPVQQALVVSKQIADLRSQINSFNEVITTVKKTSVDMKRIERALKLDEEEFHKMMPEQCPLCGRSG